jgi:hypothetical protein
MRKALICIALVGVLFGLFGTGVPSQADSIDSSSFPAVQAPSELVSLGFDPSEVLKDHTEEVMTAYVLQVMQSWHAGPVPSTDYPSVARSIARAVEHPEDGVLLASLGYIEGAGFAEYVDSGLCNKSDWRSSPEGKALMLRGGTCDGGRAHSLWQIHTAEISADFEGAPLKTKTLDRDTYARLALWMLRMDPSLCSYTGEAFLNSCPKAEKRLSFARKAIAKHPFTNSN